MKIKAVMVKDLQPSVSYFSLLEKHFLSHINYVLLFVLKMYFFRYLFLEYYKIISF